jgi:hypothetical protein
MVQTDGELGSTKNGDCGMDGQAGMVDDEGMDACMESSKHFNMAENMTMADLDA